MHIIVNCIGYMRNNESRHMYLMITVNTIGPLGQRYLLHHVMLSFIHVHPDQHDLLNLFFRINLIYIRKHNHFLHQ